MSVGHPGPRGSLGGRTERTELLGTGVENVPNLSAVTSNNSAAMDYTTDVVVSI